ncbi:Uncharacterised protein [Candidatus Tiddalikarchaeum anstoanum]|nr:Uncharacterised protein [Candidatus Tiddalikarchaeum anstoanum]
MITKKDVKNFEDQSRQAYLHVKKIAKDVSNKVEKDFGRVKVKFREGSVVKKARLDLAKELKLIANKISESAKKIKG